MKPTHTLDANYWISAANVSHLSIQLYVAQQREFTWEGVKDKKDEEMEDDEDWWRTTDARRIIDATKAAVFEAKLYGELANEAKIVYESLPETVRTIKRDRLPGSRAFETLFTTSLLGTGADKVAVGFRSKEERQRFRKDLINFYDAEHRKPKNPKELRTSWLFDNATGIYFNKYLIRAAPILPYKLGRDLMTVFFGEGSPEEFTSAPNGLLLHCEVAAAMEDGAIAIVPDLPFDPSPTDVAAFNATNPKNYKWRVIDKDAESLDARILEVREEGATEVLRVRDLDGRDVHFKDDARPRAR